MLLTTSFLCICAGTVLSTIRKPSVISFSTYLTNFPTPILLEKSSVSHSFFSPTFSCVSMHYNLLCTFNMQVLSRCHIFWQHPVKMSHLLAGSMLCVVSCTQILSKWHCVLNVIILQVLCWLFPSYTFMSVGAVHQYYESRRRLFNDSRPGRRESAKKARHSARKKELRKRVSVVSNDHSL